MSFTPPPWSAPSAPPPAPPGRGTRCCCRRPVPALICSGILRTVVTSSPRRYGGWYDSGSRPGPDPLVAAHVPPPGPGHQVAVGGGGPGLHRPGDGGLGLHQLRRPHLRRRPFLSHAPPALSAARAGVRLSGSRAASRRGAP